MTTIVRQLSAQRPALAVILARAGSKGLPGKNTRDIAGRPCFEWSILHARAATLVGAVAISTDDQAILQSVASHDDLIALPRPADLAGDSATVDAAARHAVSLLEAAAPLAERTPIVILYANVPVRPPDLIDRAVQTLISTGADSVQSYAPVGKHHPWWTARLDPDSAVVAPWEGTVLNHNVFRRQDLPPAFIPDGGVLCVTRAALFQQVPGATPGPHAFFGVDRRGIRTADGDVLDIDTRIDALVADAILRDRHPQSTPAHAHC